MKKYELAIIGSGPGGYTAAVHASQFYDNVCVIEKEELGGTCLNWGCIPTKSISVSAKLYSQALKSQEFGINIENVTADMAKIIERKDKIVKNLRLGMGSLFKTHNITLINDTAVLEDGNKIRLQNSGEDIEYEKLVIACGTNMVEGLKGLESQSSDTAKDILDCKDIPNNLLIIGGGVIGCEFASIFSALGSNVTIVEMQDRLLSNLDRSLSQGLEKMFKRKKIKCLFNADAKEVMKEQEFDKILMAVGMKSNIDGLGIENTNIKLTDKNFIDVDEYCLTNDKNIYAIGDVTGKFMLAHVAYHQAITAVNHMTGKPLPMDYSAVPNVIFTDPEIASVGLIQEQAEKNTEINVSEFSMMGLGRAHTKSDRNGFVKIISDKKTNTVLGIHILANDASEMIGEATVFVKNKMKLSDIYGTIHAHPTMNEAIWEASINTIKN